MRCKNCRDEMTQLAAGGHQVMGFCPTCGRLVVADYGELQRVFEYSPIGEPTSIEALTEEFAEAEEEAEKSTDSEEETGTPPVTEEEAPKGRGRPRAAAAA